MDERKQRASWSPHTCSRSSFPSQAGDTCQVFQANGVGRAGPAGHWAPLALCFWSLGEGCACVSMNLLQPSVLHKPSPIHHGSQQPSVIVPILKPRKLRYREEWTCQRSQTSKQVSTQACLAPRCPLEPELLFRYQPQICRASHHVPQKTLQDPSQRPS